MKVAFLFMIFKLKFFFLFVNEIHVNTLFTKYIKIIFSFENLIFLRGDYKNCIELFGSEIFN